ncbi:MAG: TonB-dependent receptor [Hyphomonadaceae bacterium]
MNRFNSTRGRTLRTSCLVLAGTLLYGAPAFAQAQGDRDVVVVTGTTTPTEKDKIGSSLTVVGKETIADEGYSYVPDVLRQVPGVAVNRAGSFGALTQVRIRGAEANHTLVLLDGIDLSSPDQGETDFSTLLTGDLERIEVLRGPQSGLYGSNALAGVINLISRRDVQGTYVNLAAEAGSWNTAQLQGGIGMGDGRDYVSAGFHALSTDGYDVSADHSAVGVTSVGPGNNAGDTEGSDIVTAYLRGGREVTPLFRVDAIARFLTKDSGLDGQAYNFPIAGGTYDDASKTSQDQMLFGGSGTLNLMDGKWQTVLSASYVDEKRRSTSTSFPFFAGPALPANATAQMAAVTLDRSGANASRTKYGLQSTFEFGSDGFVSYLTGFVENKKETYEDPFTGRHEKRTLNGIGAQYRAEIANQLYLSATVRHDDNDDFQDADTYSVATSWVVPGMGTRPHASFGTGVTNPTFFEQFGFSPGSFVGNPSLKPEEAEGWDIGVEQSLLEGNLLVDLTYFESTLENEIYTTFGPAPTFLATPANRISDSDRSGWELAFSAYPTSDIDITGSYTKLDATDPTGIEVRRPKDQAALDASWRVGGGPFQLNLGVTYNGEQVDTDFGTFTATAQDPYTLVRLGASYKLNDSVEVYGRIENLTDEKYEEVIGYLGQPQGIFVGVRFRDDKSK